MKIRLRDILFMIGLYFAFWHNCPAQETKSLAADSSLNKVQEHYLLGKEFLRQENYTAADEEFKKAQLLLESSAAEDQIIKAPDIMVIPVNKPAVLKTPALKDHEIKGGGIKKEDHPKISVSSDSPADEIISFYKRASQAIPKNPDLHYNLAVGYLKNKDFNNAALALKNALRLNPKDRDACYNLAVLYESYLGQKKEAVNYYNRYLRLSPRAADSMNVRKWVQEIKRELKLNE